MEQSCSIRLRRPDIRKWQIGGRVLRARKYLLRYLVARPSPDPNGRFFRWLELFPSFTSTKIGIRVVRPLADVYFVIFNTFETSTEMYSITLVRRCLQALLFSQYTHGDHTFTHFQECYHAESSTTEFEASPPSKRHA